MIPGEAWLLRDACVAYLSALDAEEQGRRAVHEAQEAYGAAQEAYAVQFKALRKAELALRTEAGVKWRP